MKNLEPEDTDLLSVPEAARAKGVHPHSVRLAIRGLLVTYLESGETDTVARRRLDALPGGREALARALAIKAGLAPLAGTGVSVEEYLQEKREEIEAERRRDAARDAQHS